MVPVYVPCTIKLYCPGTSEIMGSRVSCGGRSKESIKISFVSDANVMDSSSTPENSILRIAYWDCTLTSSPLNTKLICLFENVGSNFKDLALPYKKKKSKNFYGFLHHKMQNCCKDLYLHQAIPNWQLF